MINYNVFDVSGDFQVPLCYVNKRKIMVSEEKIDIPPNVNNFANKSEKIDTTVTSFHRTEKILKSDFFLDKSTSSIVPEKIQGAFL